MIVALLRQDITNSHEELNGEITYGLDSNCEVLLFNSRDEAVRFQLRAEEEFGWRGAWCLVNAQEKRTNL